MLRHIDAWQFANATLDYWHVSLTDPGGSDTVPERHMLQ